MVVAIDLATLHALLQSVNAVTFCCDCLFDRVLSNRDVHRGPEEAKSGTALIRVRGIECKPTVACPNNVAQMSLGISETTDRAGITPAGWKSLCGPRSDWLDI
jgi:hypothetical protein